MGSTGINATLNPFSSPLNRVTHIKSSERIMKITRTIIGLLGVSYLVSGGFPGEYTEDQIYNEGRPSWNASSSGLAEYEAEDIASDGRDPAAAHPSPFHKTTEEVRQE